MATFKGFKPPFFTDVIELEIRQRVERKKYNVALLVCIVMCSYSTHTNHDHMLRASAVYII